MNSKVNYYGSEVLVSPEVAAFLAESDRQIINSDEKYGRHNVPLKYISADDVLDTKHCTGRNYLLNLAAKNERRAVVRAAVGTLPEEMQNLYHLRYECDYTQQKIADMEGVSKMAICKRLKKLHRLVKEQLPDWPKEDFIEEI